MSKGISYLNLFFYSSILFSSASSSDTYETWSISSGESSSRFSIVTSSALVFSLFSSLREEVIISYRKFTCSFCCSNMFTWNRFGTSVFDFTITPFSSLRNVRIPTLRTSFIAWKAERITSSAFFSEACSASLASSSFCLISSTLVSSSFSFVFVFV